MLHPLVLGAVAVLILNDHLLKARWPSWWTGKLSDVAGLAMFPLLLQALWEHVSARGERSFRPSRTVLVGCVVLTALCFSAIKVWPLAGAGWQWGLGVLQWPFHLLQALLSGRPIPPVLPVAHTLDVTDLLTLPALLVSLMLGWRRCGPETRRVSELLTGTSRSGSTPPCTFL
ncbi:hypothetical protein [Cystobacter fuscus]|uniref:hypothetical protein n=1 Tax=Cystobacter fuscus TaxID=43 RepID=UPI0037BE693B